MFDFVSFLFFIEKVLCFVQKKKKTKFLFSLVFFSLYVLATPSGVSSLPVVDLTDNDRRHCGGEYFRLSLLFTECIVFY